MPINIKTIPIDEEGKDLDIVSQMINQGRDFIFIALPTEGSPDAVIVLHEASIEDVLHTAELLIIGALDSGRK